MSSSGSTSPRPSRRAQRRLTSVRERRPFSRLVKDLASCCSRSGLAAARVEFADLGVKETHRGCLSRRLVAVHQLQRLVRIDCRQPVGVGERPVIDEAVVARGALQIHAHEDLRDVLRGLHRRPHRGVHTPAPDDAARKALAGARRADEFRDEAVVGQVRRQRAVEPAADLLAPAVDEARAFVVVAQQVVPERQPMVRVVLPVGEQRPDERGAFLRRGIGEKVRRVAPGSAAARRGRGKPGARTTRSSTGAPGADAMLCEVYGQQPIDRMIRRSARQRHRARLQILRRRLGKRHAVRPGRALVDPRAQQTHLLRRPLRALLRHRRVRDRPRRPPRRCSSPRFSPPPPPAPVSPPFKNERARFQRKAALGLALCVALHARRLEQRLDVVHEIHGPRGSGRGSFDTCSGVSSARTAWDGASTTRAATASTFKETGGAWREAIGVDRSQDERSCQCQPQSSTNTASSQQLEWVKCVPPADAALLQRHARGAKDRVEHQQVNQRRQRAGAQSPTQPLAQTAAGTHGAQNASPPAPASVPLKVPASAAQPMNSKPAPAATIGRSRNSKIAK